MIGGKEEIIEQIAKDAHFQNPELKITNDQLYQLMIALAGDDDLRRDFDECIDDYDEIIKQGDYCDLHQAPKFFCSCE